MAAARSNLETQVVSVMRALRERGYAEARALSERLETHRSDSLERVPGLRRISSVVNGERSVPPA